MTNSVTRRSFLSASALLGAGAMVATMTGCAPQASSNSGDDASKPEDATLPPVDESAIAEVQECDVCVLGLGVAGVAAMRAAAEGGLSVIGVEKCSKPSARSTMFAAFNTERARAMGIADIDTADLVNELQIQMSHRADYRVIKRWVDHCGEAFEWYANAHEGILWLGPGDEYPADENQLYVEVSSMGEGDYRYGRDHEKTFAGCMSFGPVLDHGPILQDNVDKALATGNATVRFDCAGYRLDVTEGTVTGVVCRNLEDGTYTRIKVAKGVVIATGGYSHNEDMLERHTPWIVANQDKYLFSYAHVDKDGAFADTGDGQLMGVEAGGHLDVGPHAVMAHIMLDGGPTFLMLNERGERFANEDLSMTNVSKILVNQPGSVFYQICDADGPVRVPTLGAFSEGDWYSAQADTLEELFEQLGMDEESAASAEREIVRYNELCAAGADVDFGKAPEKLFAVEKPPFYAIRKDLLEHTSADDVFCLRLLVTMGGLVTDANARVLDAESNPIDGLYAVGNAQGGRFVDDYPFTLSGASHGAALTYGYLTGKYLAEERDV